MPAFRGSQPIGSIEREDRQEVGYLVYGVVSTVKLLLLLFFETGWRIVAQSQLTATSASRVQEILLPQPPEWLGLQVYATMPG